MRLFQSETRSCQALIFHLGGDMSGDMLKRGDMVFYRDRDHVQWGPWVVVGVFDGQATVEIESQVSYSIPAALLQKRHENCVLN